MVRNELRQYLVTAISMAALMLGLSLALLATPAATEPSRSRTSCVASAAFSGNSISMNLTVDRNEKPARNSSVAYYPAGIHADLQVLAIYPLNADKSVTAPSYLQASGWISPHDADGRFVLTVGGRDFTFEPGIVRDGAPRWHGKVGVIQNFEAKPPLASALATGGPGRLAFLDNKGTIVTQADLTFATTAAIQGAIDQAYPAALAFATNKTEC